MHIRAVLLGLSLLVMVLLVAMGLSLIYLNNRIGSTSLVPTQFEYAIDLEGKDLTVERIVHEALEKLRPQTVAGTLPALATSTIFGKLGINASKWLLFLVQPLSLDMTWRYEEFLAETGNTPMGAYVLFGLNFDAAGSVPKLKSHIATIRKRHTIELRLRDTSSSRQYLVRIEPIISADCAPSNVEIHYCRDVPDAPIMPVPKKATDWREASDRYKVVADAYGELGINSALGPVADLGGTFDDPEELAKFVVASSQILADGRMIPTLKHFAYDATRGDTHLSSYTDNRSISEIEATDFLPYRRVDEIGSPFMIMTTHHRLGALDLSEPASKSILVTDYIHTRFPNAVILVDEISMVGFDPSAGFAQRVEDVRGDMFIVHSGILDAKGRRQAIYDGLARRDEQAIRSSLIRILKLKQHFGLMTIFEERE